MRVVGLVILLIAMVLAGTVPDAIAQTATRIQIEAFDFGFRPIVTVLEVGKPVTLVFVNAGRVPHSVASAYFNDQDIRATGQFTEGIFEPDHWRYFQTAGGQRFELTFVPKPGPRSGQVVFICRVGNGSHAAAGMAGAFIIKR